MDMRMARNCLRIRVRCYIAWASSWPPDYCTQRVSGSEQCIDGDGVSRHCVPLAPWSWPAEFTTCGGLSPEKHPCHIPVSAHRRTSINGTMHQLGRSTP